MGTSGERTSKSRISTRSWVSSHARSSAKNDAAFFTMPLGSRYGTVTGPSIESCALAPSPKMIRGSPSAVWSNHTLIPSSASKRRMKVHSISPYCTEYVRFW